MRIAGRVQEFGGGRSIRWLASTASLLDELLGRVVDGPAVTAAGRVNVERRADRSASRCSGGSDIS